MAKEKPRKERKERAGPPTQAFVYWAATLVFFIALGFTISAAIPLVSPPNPCLQYFFNHNNAPSSCQNFSPSPIDFYDLGILTIGNALHIGFYGFVAVLLVIAALNWVLFVGLIWTAWRVKHETVLVHRERGPT